MHLAAAAGGAAARQGINYLADRFAGPWNVSQPTAGPAVVYVGSPVQSSRGGGRRRRGGRGRGRAGRNSARGPARALRTSGETVTITGQEVVDTLKGTLKTYVFNPGTTTTPRLKAFEAMYERFRFNSVKISYTGTTSAMTAGAVTYGILPGVTEDIIKLSGDILKIRPSTSHACYKNSSIVLPNHIDSSRWMHCGNSDDAGVSFVLYSIGEAEKGYFSVHYNITFSNPRPF